MIGHQVSVDTLRAAILRHVPGARLPTSGPSLPIAPGIAEEGIDEAFPSRQLASLADGIRATIAHYRAPVLG